MQTRRHMKPVVVIALITGMGLGVLWVALLMSGWLGLVPYPMIASGALLMVGGIVGAVTGDR